MASQKHHGTEVPDKVYFYYRVSSQHQVTGDGFDRQADTILGWRRSLGQDVELLGQYQDEGVSGTKEMIDRPGLREMIQDMEKRVGGYPSPPKYWAAVVVERSDRFSRDLVIGELLLKELSNLGVKVICAEGNTDLTTDPDDPSQKLIRHILGAIAEYEKDSLVVKLRKARQRAKARTGRCEGQKPFGHYPNEKEVLEVIRRQAQRGFGGNQIAAQLNAHNRGEAPLADCNPKWGYPPRSGRKWHGSSVRGILDRERQAGRL